MSSSSLISLPDTYPTYQIVISTIAAIYAALFVSISNNTVFKPKLQHLFQHSTINSTSLHQFLIDLLSNLTHLTFLLVSLFMFQDDNSLSVIIYSDMSWSGLFLAIVAFKAINFKEEPNFKLMLLKNILFLLLAYFTIFFHYVTKTYLMSIGLILMLLYLVNLMANGNEENFVESMEVLFGYKPVGEIEHEYNHSSNVPCPQYLSRTFPVTKEEIAEHMQKHFKTKNVHLKTKRSMSENMLKISLALHLSKKKLQNKAKRDIKNYYGTFNGTVVEKSKKMIIEKVNTYQEQESQDDFNKQSTQQESQGHNSAIFYIFPVKLFQSSKPLSVLFSICINLGLGALISICLKMAETFKYGQYFQILYGFLLLPVIPSVNKEEFMHSMTLSALCKYFIYGMFMTIVCLFSETIPFFSFTANPQLVFAPIIQLVGLAITAYHLFKPNSSPYLFSFIWMGSMLVTLLMIFKYC